MPIHVYVIYMYMLYICICTHTHIFLKIQIEGYYKQYVTWIQLEIIILSEVSQKETDKYHMISLTSGI